MRMPSIILGIFGIVTISIMMSGCSLRFFDPQYYRFKSLTRKESGFYIHDEQTYNERRIESRLLPNGYEWDMDSDEKRTEIDSRIVKCIDFEIFYIDDLSKKHIIQHRVSFDYLDYGIFLGGDEGRGFWIDTFRIIGGYKDQSFILKDGKWQRTKK